MKKFIDLIIVLIVAALFYTAVIVPLGEKAKDPAATTTKATDSSSVTAVSSTIAPSNQYFDGDCGYVIIDNVTYFVKKVTVEKTGGSYKVYGRDFSTYTFRTMYSSDLRVFKLADDTVSTGSSVWEIYLPSAQYKKGDVLYISYCQIQNCVEPDVVLNHLKNYVFSDSSYFRYSYSDAVGDEVMSGAN